jgi:hypothetical protein
MSLAQCSSAMSRSVPVTEAAVTAQTQAHVSGAPPPKSGNIWWCRHIRPAAAKLPIVWPLKKLR